MAVFRLARKMVPVSVKFITEYMPEAHGEYVKVYLYGLSAACSGIEADNAAIAKLLHILVADVENAWKYWSEKGLVRLGDGTVDFVCPTEEDAPSPASEPEQPPAEDRPPHVSAAEVARALEMNPAMKDTISMAEQMLEKPLSSREITAIYNLMDWYGMDSALVLMLLEYCISQGKKNFSYIEKTAQGWNRDGITDIKSAEAVIKRATDERRFQGRCKKIFGLERAFTVSELKYLNSWRSELGFSPEMVSRAYDITVNNTGKLAFAYMNRILQSWHEKGVRRPADIKERDSRPAQAHSGGKMDEQALIEMRRRLGAEDKS